MSEQMAERLGRLQAFIISLADYYDMPGPSNHKTAEHYHMAARARELRAEILLSQHTDPGANHGS